MRGSFIRFHAARQRPSSCHALHLGPLTASTALVRTTEALQIGCHFSFTSMWWRRSLKGLFIRVQQTPHRQPQHPSRHISAICASVAVNSALWLSFISMAFWPFMRYAHCCSMPVTASDRMLQGSQLGPEDRPCSHDIGLPSSKSSKEHACAQDPKSIALQGETVCAKDVNSPMMVGSDPYGMPVTVLTRVRMVRMWFLYSWMALGSVKKSSQPVAVVVQLVYAHLHRRRAFLSSLIS